MVASCPSSPSRLLENPSPSDRRWTGQGCQIDRVQTSPSLHPDRILSAWFVVGNNVVVASNSGTLLIDTPVGLPDAPHLLTSRQS